MNKLNVQKVKEDQNVKFYKFLKNLLLELWPAQLFVFITNVFHYNISMKPNPYLLQLFSKKGLQI